MSKLYDHYLFLKSHEIDANNTLYLFKSGIFFIFLDGDAKIASNLLNLKISYFAQDVVKCGFPQNSLEKYKSLLAKSSYHFKIIDNASIKPVHSCIDEKIENLLHKISAIDTNTLSIKEAYDFIEEIKIYAKSIM